MIRKSTPKIEMQKRDIRACHTAGRAGNSKHGFEKTRDLKDAAKNDGKSKSCEDQQLFRLPK